jgi:predicted nuclease of predicted toxin-antitoxin system
VKLLFDEMLAPSLVHRLRDLFQDSEHVRNLGLKQTPDTDVWHQAKKLGYVIVTKDKDFANLSLVWSAPPKVIFLQLGNCSVQQMEDRLRRDAVRISEFVTNSPKSLLVITR